MSRLAEILATQSLRIQAQRIAAKETAMIDDADPVPAALTAEGVPLFRSIRSGKPSQNLAHLITITMTTAEGDLDRAAILLRAALEHIETRRRPYGLDVI